MRAGETGETRARVGMGLLFYPRGGSAQVTHYLATALIADGWDVELVSGSLGPPGDPTEAATFFAGLEVHPVDYTAAVAAHRVGADPMQTAMPMHPSYEDRSGVPDRFLAAVEPALAEYLVDAWVRALPGSFLRSDIFHLHHLTPLHEAVTRLRPDAPIVAHLHGTELKFLQALPALPDSVAPYAGFWSHRLRAIATTCRRLVVGSPTDKVSACALLGVDPDRIDIVPGGVDTDSFRPQVLGDGERLAMFRRWLVDDPQGWDESCVPGSIRYTDAELRGFVDPSTGETRPVVLFVGRFTAVKRIPLLLRAWARARQRFAAPAALVIWGGHPGEFEDEHPAALARRLDLDDVFFLGWRGHEELPSGLAASDLLVLPSVNESFGLVAIEAMATGIPVIATRSGGPPSFINTDPKAPTGWLVPPDDEGELASALVEAVNQPEERRRRGDRSLVTARTGYSWPAIAGRFEAIYAQLLHDREGP